MATQYHTLDREVLDCLDSLLSAYEGLEVLAGMARADSCHVARVLAVLNSTLEREIDHLSPKPAGLRIVKDE